MLSKFSPFSCVHTIVYITFTVRANKFGAHGEHAHDYEWDENGKLKNKTIREISNDERERSGDIL